MPKQPDPHEQAIYNMVEQATGVTIEHHDDGSEPGMFDAYVVYPDGRRAALEVTKVADTNEFHLAARDRVEIPGNSDWLLMLNSDLMSDPVTIRDIEKYVPDIVRRCDKEGVDRADLLSEFRSFSPFVTNPDPAIWWIHAVGGHYLTRMRGQEVPGKSVVHISRAFGGSAEVGIPEIEEWLESQTSEPWFVENASKLVKSGLEELHLAVSLHPVATPSDILISSISTSTHFEDATTSFSMPPLTDLWLFFPHSEQYLHLSKDDGWKAHSLS